jgi:hypothetical protein
MDVFSTKIHDNGAMYVPRRVGCVRSSWRRKGGAIQITLTPAPGKRRRRYCCAIPMTVVKQSLHNRRGSTIHITFSQDIDNVWYGEYRLRKGWETVKGV